MKVRSAQAEWNGDLKGGKGSLKTESGAVDTKYNFMSRFEDGSETNPEELIGAAHAGCFSMALANILAEAGHTPRSVRTTARVQLEMLDQGPTITRIELRTRGDVPGLDADGFQEHAEAAKNGCPVSRALEAVEITLDAALEG
jgi:lipoyl-dependent peroxiredoxin